MKKTIAALFVFVALAAVLALKLRGQSPALKPNEKQMQRLVMAQREAYVMRRAQVEADQHFKEAYDRLVAACVDTAIENHWPSNFDCHDPKQFDPDKLSFTMPAKAPVPPKK